MAKPGASIYITTFDSSKTLNTHTCLDKYEEVVEAIEDKIDQFNKQKYDRFEEWVKLNEHINIKKKDLDECYKQKFLTVDLNHSEKVKAFRDQRANYPECSNKPAYSAEVPVKLKAKTEHSCGAKKDCTEITEPGKQKSELKEKESKSKPGVGTRTPETGTAKGQTLLQTGHSPAHGEEPGQEKLIPPVSRVTNPSDKSAQTHVETVQSRENHLSNKPEQLENFTQSSLALETPAGQTDTSSKEISSAEISDPKGSSEAVGLSSRGPQSNSEGGASSDSILAGHQVSGKTNEGQTHGNKGDTTETSVEAPSSLKGTDRRASVEGSLVNKELKGSDTEGASSQSTVVNRVDADSVSHASASLGDVTHDPKPTVHVKFSATHSSGEQALDVVINNEGSSHTVPVREGGDGRRGTGSPGELSDKNSLSKAASALSQEGKDTEKGKVHQDAQCQNENLPSQLKACTNPQLDNLENVHEQQKGRVEDTGETVNTEDGIIMLYKEYILMSLLPLAIILLLTVLVKFTPLGMLFNNKKRKKRKDINAKLQRILQEPSMARDQRSVPFSYSSFGYSSY